MADRDASKVQLDFPQLTADIIAALRLTGTLGLFDMSDVVIPTISVGNVRPQTFVFQPVTFTSAEVFSGTVVDAVGASTVIDTGQLAAGTYDLAFILNFVGSIALPQDTMELQHRNAANDTTLAILGGLGGTNAQFASVQVSPLIGYEIAQNERIRWLTFAQIMDGVATASLYLRLRPTP